MTKFLLHGKFSTQPSKGDELEDILLQAAELMKKAKGCRQYAISRSEENADEVWVTEIWDNKEDHDNSLSVPGVRELIGQAMPLLAGAPQKGQELILKGGTYSLL